MHPILSKKRAQAISTALFLVGLAILLFIDKWWPGIMLVIGLPLSLKQLFQGRISDMFLSLFVFAGFFVIAQFNISWKILIPILFIMAAVYILCKEWVEGSAESEVETEENLNIEIEEDETHRRK